MNNLSWMIYLADIVGSVGILLTLFLAIVIFVFACRLVGAAVSSAADDDSTEVKTAASRLWRPLLYVAAPVAAVLVVTPSSGTVYAIAASEMGEDVLNSKTGGKAVKALDAWLDRQIAGEDGVNAGGEEG